MAGSLVHMDDEVPESVALAERWRVVGRELRELMPEVFPLLLAALEQVSTTPPAPSDPDEKIS